MIKYRYSTTIKSSFLAYIFTRKIKRKKNKIFKIDLQKFITVQKAILQDFHSQHINNGIIKGTITNKVE